MRQRQGYTFSIVGVLWGGLLRGRRSGLDRPAYNGKTAGFVSKSGGLVRSLLFDSVAPGQD